MNQFTSKVLLGLCIFSILGITASPTLLFSQSKADSILQLIKTEESDSLLIKHYGALIKTKTKKELTEIEDLFNVASQIATKNSDPKPAYSLQFLTAEHLYSIGLLDKSIDLYNSIREASTGTTHNRYALRSQIAIIDILSKQSNHAEAKDEAFALIKSAKDDEFVSKAYESLARICLKTGELDLAQAYIDTCIQTAQEISLGDELSNAFLIKGKVHRAQGNYDSTSHYYHKAYDLSKDKGTDKEIATILNNLGNASQLAGNYDKAIEYYVKSLTIKETLNDLRGLCIGYHNIGTIQNDMKEYEASKENFEKSMDIAIEIQDKPLEIHNLLRLGHVEESLGNFDKAIELNKKARKKSEAHSFTKGLVSSIYNLGVIHMNKGDHYQSYEYLVDVLGRVKKIGSKPYEAATLSAIAKNYTLELKHKKENIELAKDPSFLSPKDVQAYLKRANTLADEMNSTENKIDVLEALSMFHQETGNYKEASSALRAFMTLKDSIYQKDRSDAIASWETKYNVAKKNQEIAELDLAKNIAIFKSNRNRTLFIGSILFFIGLIGFLLTYLRQRNARMELKRKEEFRSKLSSDLHDDVGSILTGLSMQTELLQMQSDPSIKDQFEKINEMSRSAMSRMRDTVWAIDANKDSVRDLVDRMLDFNEDTIAPTGKNVVFTSNLTSSEESIKPDIRQALYLVYKEAITNAMKYGTTDKIQVDLRREGKALKLSIKNDTDITKDQMKTSGLGMRSMAKRMEKINGTFSYTTDDGFTVLASVQTD